MDDPAVPGRPARRRRPGRDDARMMTARETAVTVRGLRKTYAGRVAVDRLDLDIYRGEVFALLGPNGAGKTTTVEILEGHRHRDGGTAEVLGEDPGRRPRGWRSRIGIVLQSLTDGGGELTVREIVGHFAHYYPRARDPDEVIETVGLTPQARTRLPQLSGGQRRRVDVALGIVGRPELLFLDEPTTGFDPAARRAFWELISRLAAAGTTILLTTHYLEEAEALADRVGVLAGGRLLAAGTPAEIGGRATAQATVSWQDGPRARAVRTDAPTQLIAGLAGRHDGEIPGLTVTRPTLEDTYLALIAAQENGAPR
jgi:ABC-2 type transport system ATP-binding protein